MATLIAKPFETTGSFAGIAIPEGATVIYVQGAAAESGDLPIGYAHDIDLGAVTLLAGGEPALDLLPTLAPDETTTDEPAHPTSAALFEVPDDVVAPYVEAELARDEAFLADHPGAPLWTFAATTGPTGEPTGATPDEGGATDPTVPVDDTTTPPADDATGAGPTDDGTTPPAVDPTGTDNGQTDEPTDTGTTTPEDDTLPPVIAPEDDAGLPSLDDVTIAAVTLTQDLAAGAPALKLLTDFQDLNSQLLTYVSGLITTETSSGQISTPEAGRAFGEALGKAIGDAMKEALAGLTHDEDGPTPGVPGTDFLPGSDIVTDPPAGGTGTGHGADHEDHGQHRGWCRVDEAGHGLALGHSDHGAPA